MTFKEAIERGNDLFKKYPEVFVFFNTVAGFDIKVSKGGFVTITPSCTYPKHAVLFRHKDGGNFCLGPRAEEDWKMLERAFEQKKLELTEKCEQYTRDVLNKEPDLHEIDIDMFYGRK